MEWVTAKENTEHAIKTKLRKMYGENNHANKYKKETVLEIRKFKKQNKKFKEVYQLYKTIMTYAAFWDIWNYHSWKHVGE